MNNNIFIEVTTTNNCNCNCAYCFEGKHYFEERNLEIEKRQLDLIFDACNTFDKSKYTHLTISFWGGEPFMNFDFMDQIFEKTYKFDFVQYHCYSNGLLVDKYQQLVKKSYFDSIKHRLIIQLSYDGEPHHSIKRGNTKVKILNTARFLRKNEVYVTFKATLSYDMIDKLPEIWDSYDELTKEFKYIQYFPTLDTSCSPKPESFEIWKKVIVEIAKKEYKRIKENDNVRPLWQWFDNGRKMNCALGNSIHMHNDGNIYICHGCPYLKNSKRFIIKNINEINSLYEVISEKFNLELNQKCVNCEATHCSSCHVSQIRDDQDIYEKWSECRSNDENKCKYYKWFGYIAKLLKYEVLKINKKEY